MATNTSASRANANGNDVEDAARNVAESTKDLASGIADKAAAAAARLPDAANAAGTGIEKASRAVQAESDEVLAVGTALSVGLAMGLLLGGANRILVILAMIPATAMGFTLFDRHGGTRTGVRRTS